MSIGRIGSYELLERLGEGGMGVVYRARDTRLFRIVALKFLTERLRQDRAHYDRLLHEARSLAALNHPHVAICYDCAEGAPEPPDLLAPGTPGPHPATVCYLAMEFVPGRDVRSLVRSGSLTLRESLRIAGQVASGLEAAHRAGVVHRDLTPTNIRVNADGDVKILDFGLARSSGAQESISTSSGSEARSIAGTVGYMSPEQAAGLHVDGRSDLFSLGVILYEMIAGRAPFRGETMVEVLYSIANDQPHPLARYSADVSPELERIVAKLLEKSPDDRYQSAHEVLTDLKRLEEVLHHSKRDHTSEPGHRPHPRPPRRRVAATGFAVLGVAIAMGIGPLLLPPRTDAQRVAFVEFQNRTGDATFDDICAGLASELHETFVQASDLTVARAEAATHPAGSEPDPRAIAKDLGVGRVVTGELDANREGPRLLVHVYDGKLGRERRSFSMPMSLPPSPALRLELSLAVAHALGVNLARPPVTTPTNPVPNTAYEAYLRGMGALASPDDPLSAERALADFDRAIAGDSTLAVAWAGRSRALWWNYDKRHDTALLHDADVSAQTALTLAPDLVQVRMAHARIARETGRVDEAIADLRSVLLAKPNYDVAYAYLGATLRRAGRLAEAESSYRRAVELRPGSWNNWQSLGNFLMTARADYPGARMAYQRVVELLPESNRGYEGLGNAYIMEGRYNDAIAAYQRLPLPVTTSGVASNIATAHFFAHQLEPALQYYLLAVSLEPQDAGLRQNLGDCYERMGRTSEARSQYREAVSLQRPALAASGGSPREVLTLALYYAKSGDCDACRSLLASCEPTLPRDDAELLHVLAKAQALCGRADEAVETLGRMVRLGQSAGMIGDEDEFRSLRSHPGFKKLVSGT